MQTYAEIRGKSEELIKLLREHARSGFIPKSIISSTASKVYGPDNQREIEEGLKFTSF